MKKETLQNRIENEIIESIIHLDYNILDKINKKELTLNLICVTDKYYEAKLKLELEYLKELFFSAGSEDVEEYIDKQIITLTN